jgi:hypothetical protein
LAMLAWISFGFSLARIARCVVPRIRAQVLWADHYFVDCLEWRVDVFGSWGGWESAIPFLFYLGLDGLNLIMCRLCWFLNSLIAVW